MAKHLLSLFGGQIYHYFINKQMKFTAPPRCLDYSIFPPPCHPVPYRLRLLVDKWPPWRPRITRNTERSTVGLKLRRKRKGTCRTYSLAMKRMPGRETLKLLPFSPLCGWLGPFTGVFSRGWWFFHFMKY